MVGEVDGPAVGEADGLVEGGAEGAMEGAMLGLDVFVALVLVTGALVDSSWGSAPPVGVV